MVTTTGAARMDARAIADVARRAGFAGDALVVAVAVALAESGGDPRAHNGVPPDDSFGLWQINMIGQLGVARRAQLGISTNEALYDPETNARAAYGIASGGTNFKPWTTYTGGRYQAFMAEAAAGVNGTTTGGTNARRIGNSVPTPFGDIAVPGVVADAVGAAKGVLSAGETLAKVAGLVLRPDFWVRTAQVFGGVAVVIVGVSILKRDTIKAAAVEGGMAAATGGASVAAKAGSGAAGKLAGAVQSKS